MKSFILVNEEKEIKFNLPTSFEEITEEYLKAVTEHIQVADNYSLVGIVYHETLGSIILTCKQNKKSFTAGVVPVFIKAGNCDSAFIANASIKDKIVVASSQLALGHHVIANNNVLSLDYFYKYLDKDNTVAERYKRNYGKEECYFIEFKIIPNCDIVGFYKNTTKNKEIIDKFVTITNSEIDI